MKASASSALHRELMLRLQDATTAVGALESWIGCPGSIVYEQHWQSSRYTLTTKEVGLLQAPPNLDAAGFKRTGFLRRNTDGRALAFVEAVVLPEHLPPWVMFELLNSCRTIGSMIVGAMEGKRTTLSVKPIRTFDREGAPLAVQVQALLSAAPVGEEVSRPLAVVTEWIYKDVLEMKW